MRSLLHRLFSVVAGCSLLLLLLVHGSEAAPPTKASRRSPAPRRAAPSAPKDADVEAKAADVQENTTDKESAQRSDDKEPAPLPEPEPEAADNAVAAPSSTEDGADATPQPQSADSDSTEAGSDAADKTQPGNATGEEEDSAPLPPGGGLAEKIKRADMPVDRPEPAEFHGIRVGRAKVADVDRAWGTVLSVTRQKDMVRRVYRLEATGRVEVLCGHDVVQSIVVHYDQHPRWSELTGPLGLENIETVDVIDEFGEVVGVALPESGVLAAFRPGNSRRVAEIVYEPIDPQAFTLRAERSLGRDYTACQRDLDLALVVDPKCARAYWLRARALTAIGQVDAATKAAEEAVRLEPKNPQFQLTASALAAEAGQFEKAMEQSKKAVTLCTALPALKACALNQLGEQLSAGPGRNYKQALPLHVEAIKLAEPLAHDRRVFVRQTAREALITAHLSAARNIAWGNWKMKKKMVPAWLNRAEELADEATAGSEPSLDTRLRVCSEALTACVGVEGDLDATPWIEKALTLATPAIEAAEDPLRRRELQWKMGAALYDALQVYHTIGDAHQATKYGTLAVTNLEAGAEGRQLEPVEAYLLGRLYYRMGSVCAIHVKDADQAVAWFERAVPLLERPLPTVALADLGRHGESFVSMGVSYWDTGSHDEALRLTSEGMKLMQQAIKDGTLEELALQVPYTNLATMHRFLGDDEQADAFGEMAAKSTDVKRQ